MERRECGGILVPMLSPRYVHTYPGIQKTAWIVLSLPREYSKLTIEKDSLKKKKITLHTFMGIISFYDLKVSMFLFGCGKEDDGNCIMPFSDPKRASRPQNEFKFT